MIIESVDVEAGATGTALYKLQDHTSRDEVETADISWLDDCIKRTGKTRGPFPVPRTFEQRDETNGRQGELR